MLSLGYIKGLNGVINEPSKALKRPRDLVRHTLNERELGPLETWQFEIGLFQDHHELLLWIHSDICIVRGLSIYGLDFTVKFEFVTTTNISSRHLGWSSNVIGYISSCNEKLISLASRVIDDLVQDLSTHHSSIFRIGDLKCSVLWYLDALRLIEDMMSQSRDALRSLKARACRYCLIDSQRLVLGYLMSLVWF